MQKEHARNVTATTTTIRKMYVLHVTNVTTITRKKMYYVM